jgi:LysM repeat protein
MNTSENNDDKTRIFSPENETNDADQNVQKPLNTAGEKEKKGVHPGILAAGVGAAALGGVAAGTAFSQEIKDGLGISHAEDHSSNTNTIELPTNASTGTENTTPEIAASHNETVNNPHLDDQASSPTSFHGSRSMHGNEEIYHVNALDHGSSNPNSIDSLHIEAEKVDGSHVEFTASGPILDSMMLENNAQYAHGTEYIEAANDGSVEGYSATTSEGHDYEIKYGDTLSELAAEHNTSVARIMELNPHLENPNIIMAGEHIVLPENDHISNPYEGWQAEWSETPHHDVHQHAVEISDGTMEEEYNTEEQYQGDDYLETEEISHDDHGVSGEYESMDWESFEDQPMDDYSSHLDHTDFNSYDDPNAYLDHSNDIDSSEFC